MDKDIISADFQQGTFLRGLRPVLQPPAPATHEANVSFTTAAFQPPAPAARAAHTASKPAASALPAVKSASNPAAMQPPAPSLAWIEGSRRGKPLEPSPLPVSDTYLETAPLLHRLPKLHGDFLPHNKNTRLLGAFPRDIDTLYKALTMALDTRALFHHDLGVGKV